MEYGSDFHFIESHNSTRSNLFCYYDNYELFADGRQCIISILKHDKYKRLWVPEYFCYEVIDSLKGCGIHICFYLDYPGFDECNEIENIPFEEGDVLLRVNYFGTRCFRNEKNIPVPVIEDHTHDLLSDWALHSNAEWCISSLRKTLPIPEGGLLWSPQGLKLQKSPQINDSNKELASQRWKAMELKSKYMKGDSIDKELFRSLYVSTEDAFSNLPICSIDERSKLYIPQFDVSNWYLKKKRNWNILFSKINNKIKVLLPESESCNMFSFILLFESKLERDNFRKNIIEDKIYPAILWNVDSSCSDEVIDFSSKMLSIHCDGRYSENDIIELAEKLNSLF